MPELSPDRFSRAIPLISHGRGIARAVAERQSPGRIWVDDPARPERALVSTIEIWQLFGPPGNAAFERELCGLILDPACTVAAGPERVGLNIAVDPAAWADRLPSLFDGCEPLPDPRIYLELEPHELRSAPSPDGYVEVNVDESFLERAELADHDVVKWIGSHYLDRAQFLAHGSATCLMSGETIASWCVTDCVSGEMAEVGIETDPAHRRRGLARAAVAATCAKLFGRGVRTVGWHCAAHNAGSLRAAASVGFERVYDYGSWFRMFDDLEQRLVHGWWDLTIGGDPISALERLRAAFAAGGERVQAGWFVHAAVAAARLGEDAEALDHLAAAEAGGWDGFARLAADPDFKDLARLSGLRESRDDGSALE